MLQFIEQCFCVNQISRIEAFAEPIIDRSQQVIGFLALPLLSPETSQAGGGAKFPRFSALILGDCKGLVKGCLGFSAVVSGEL